MPQDRGLGSRSSSAGEELHGNPLPFARLTIRLRHSLGPRHKLHPSQKLVPRSGHECAYPRGIADHKRRLDPSKESREVRVRQAIVQGTVGHAGKRGTEQRNRGGFATGVEQGDLLATTCGNRGGCAGRRVPELAIAPGSAIAGQTDPIRLGIRSHFQQKRNIH